MDITTDTTLDALYQADGKAELLCGEIVPMSPTGWGPGRAGGKIYRRLADYEERQGGGYAFPDNVGFVVDLPHRQSFSPDAAYYTGASTGMHFVQGAPVFAVEVHSANDYGPAAERAMAEKRADYFACGTLVVWDVDLLSPAVIKAYQAHDPAHPMIFRRGDVAHAEPAVPGWRLAVDELFA